MPIAYAPSYRPRAAVSWLGPGADLVRVALESAKSPGGLDVSPIVLPHLARRHRAPRDRRFHRHRRGADADPDPGAGRRDGGTAADPDSGGRDRFAAPV